MWQELWEFIWANKNWWLIPPLVVFTIFGVLVLFSSTSPVSPFIYMLF